MRIEDRPPPYGTVAFDCDSTLSAMEGIEELSAGRSAALAEMTSAAMEGSVPLESVYRRRLELVRPSRADVARIGRLYVERRLPHAAELVRALRRLGKRVRIVSGGLLPAVMHLGSALGLEESAVEAVDVRFDADGAYAGFDEASPLCRSGGKAEVLARIAAEPGAGLVAFVGDGATDLEAAPVVARFVAFGGVERRAAVFAAARVTCDAPDLAALLPLLCTPAEIAALTRDPACANLLGAARSEA